MRGVPAPARVGWAKRSVPTADSQSALTLTWARRCAPLPTLRLLLEDGRSGIAIGVGDRVVHCASRFFGVFLENLAAPLGRAQSPAVKIGEHFLGRRAESYTFDRADLGETDQAQCQGLQLGGLLRLGPFLGLGGLLHGLWHRLTLSDSAKNSRVHATAWRSNGERSCPGGLIP